jgi:threonine efflux protein
MDITMLTSIAVIMLVALVSPGPDFVVVTRTVLARGSRAGFAVALGIAVGVFFYATLAMTGLAVILHQFAFLMAAIKIAGALYLFWLAIQIWKSAGAMPTLEKGDDADKTFMQDFTLGFITNLTNPKAIAFFSSVFAVALVPDVGIATKISIPILCALLAVLWFGFVSFGFGRPAVRLAYARLKTNLDRFTALLMAGFGVKLLAEAGR